VLKHVRCGEKSRWLTGDIHNEQAVIAPRWDRFMCRGYPPAVAILSTNLARLYDKNKKNLRVSVSLVWRFARVDGIAVQDKRCKAVVLPPSRLVMIAVC